jgi:hypothetical protein
MASQQVAFRVVLSSILSMFVCLFGCKSREMSVHGMLAGRSGTAGYVTTERVHNVCSYITVVINN